MKTRIITGLILTMLILVVTYYGSYVFDAFYLTLTIVAIYEFTRLFRSDKPLGYEFIINLVFAISLYIAQCFYDLSTLNFIIYVYLGMNFIIFIVFSDIKLNRLSNSLIIGIYLVLFLHYMFRLNDTPYVWLVYFIAFGTDTCAYFTGVTFGKHKLCPVLSPKKTIEGALGGILGSSIITIMFFSYLSINKMVEIIIFSIIASIFSMFGDLIASKIKREYKIKDYGNVFPGHGGVMDRFDSVVFVAPVVYYFVKYFIGGVI